MAFPNTLEQIVAMPIRELALGGLARLVQASQVNRKNFIAQVYALPSGALTAGSTDESPGPRPGVQGYLTPPSMPITL